MSIKAGGQEIKEMRFDRLHTKTHFGFHSEMQKLAGNSVLVGPGVKAAFDAYKDAFAAAKTHACRALGKDAVRRFCGAEHEAVRTLDEMTGKLQKRCKGRHGAGVANLLKQVSVAVAGAVLAGSVVVAIEAVGVNNIVGKAVGAGVGKLAASFMERMGAKNRCKNKMNSAGHTALVELNTELENLVAAFNNIKILVNGMGAGARGDGFGEFVMRTNRIINKTMKIHRRGRDERKFL